MAMQWIREERSVWDEDKQRIIGGAPVGAFDRRYHDRSAGDLMPGEWWKALDGDEVVGFGWMDIVWGEGEILLAVDPARRGRGVGGFILQHLEEEARHRRLTRIYNIVRPSHPEADGVSAWLTKHGFTPSTDGSLVRTVRPRGA